MTDNRNVKLLVFGSLCKWKSDNQTPAVAEPEVYDDDNWPNNNNDEDNNNDDDDDDDECVQSRHSVRTYRNANVQ